jgi:uncharacterized protein with von Willebrand factor type A (vWA) domain
VTIVDGLVDELRATGIPVGLAEHVDASRALGEVDVFDRDALRDALRTTLIKDVACQPTFDLVFELYFAGLRPGEVTGPDRRPGGALITGLSDAELRTVLTTAVREDDGGLIRRMVSLMVDRHARFEPGLPVAGTVYQLRTMRAIDPDALHAALLGERGTAGWEPAGRLDRRLAVERADEGVLRVQREVTAEIRSRLVADRGAAAVAKTLRHPLPEDADFLRADQQDADALRAVIQPLARKLAARLSARRRRSSRGTLDFRRTIRRSLSTGGVPVDPVFRPRRPAKPRLVVLADISGSVATFAAFTLRLVHALRTEFAAVRSFVFVDGVDEVTGLFADAGDLTDVTRSINERASGVWLDGRSDYGHVLESFRDRFAAGLSTRSTVLVLGDARSNHHEPRADALAAIAARAGHVYWLNPEPRTAWDTGDSVIGRYAPHCDRVVECRSVRQLRRFVLSLENPC